jgi:hypothetical protein
MNLLQVTNLKAKIAQHCCAGQWFAGIRLRRRIHPYDGEELAFPTCGWVYAETESPAEAVEVVRQLIVQGIALPHGQNEPGKIVFAYLITN